MLVAALAALSPAQPASPESQPRIPRFSDFPFDEWAAEPDRSPIRWELRLPAPQLSAHQRLIARIEAVVPGSELEKRRGRGDLILLARFEDSDGRRWPASGRLNLAKVQAGVKSQELTLTLSAFVRPGDYRVLAALIDSETMEHDFTHRKLHIAPLKPDPLPDAWLGLPPVEVLPFIDTPDSWFLPAVKNLLHLPLRNADKLPPRIDLLVNLTPSGRSRNSVGSLRASMSVVIPALKVLSGLNEKLRPPSAAVVDLARHRVGFETSNAAALDWKSLAGLLTESNPGIIDAKSLALQSSMRDYFTHEIARRAGASGPPRWLIVLSGRLDFVRQDETPLPELPPDPNRHIVYLRFASAFGYGPRNGVAATLPPDVRIGPPQRVHGPMPGYSVVLPGGPGRGRGPDGGEVVFPDDIERVLRPLGAQIVGVSTPESFRKALADLMGEISAN
jgi:hypothetical protein